MRAPAAGRLTARRAPRSPLAVWDYRQLALFNWAWQECATLLPYTTETAFLAGLFGDGAAVSVHSVLRVMENLSPNAHKSFYILAALQWQVQSDGGAAFTGLPFGTYLALCASNFAASNDNQLRNFLTEFGDHKLLKTQQARHVNIRDEDVFLFTRMP